MRDKREEYIMIILNKKRIMVIMAMLIIATCAFTLQTAQIKKTVPTVSLPVSNKVIVIDAGHGVPDEGAQSTNRNNRSRNKLKNSFKIAKPTRTSRKYRHPNQKR